MFLEFKSDNEQKYKIIRDYFVANGKQQGIYFVVQDMENENNPEIKEVFLPKEQMNNEFVPSKAKKEEVKFRARGIITGEENLLIVQTGVWTKKKLFNRTGEVTAKKYIFQLKEK